MRFAAEFSAGPTRRSGARMALWSHPESKQGPREGVKPWVRQIPSMEGTPQWLSAANSPYSWGEWVHLSWGDIWMAYHSIHTHLQPPVYIYRDNHNVSSGANEIMDMKLLHKLQWCVVIHYCLLFVPILPSFTFHRPEWSHFLFLPRFIPGSLTQSRNQKKQGRIFKKRQSGAFAQPVYTPQWVQSVARVLCLTYIWAQLLPKRTE